jgi:predicted PurR-regulated permease PerM
MTTGLSEGTPGSSNGSNKNSSLIPHWTPRQVFIATIVVLLVLLGFWFLFRFRLVFFGLFEAIVFSTALRPMVDWMQQRGISRVVGAALIYIAVVLFLVSLIVLFIPLFTGQGTSIANTLVHYYQNLREALLTSPSIVLTRLAMRLPSTLVLTPAPAAVPTPANPSEPLDQAAVVLSYGRSALHGIFSTLIVLLLTYYWTIDRDRILRSILIFIPNERREPSREFFEASEAKVGAYLRGLAIMCATIGVLSGIAYIIIGLPYIALLAVLAGLMEAVPLIGPVIGALPAVLVALALDPSKVLWVVLSTIIIQQFENQILVPRVMNESVGVNPVVSLLAFVIFSSLFGMAGALLAIPLAATLQLIVNRTVIETTETAPAGRDTISVLRYEAQALIQDVRKQVRIKETTIDDPSDQVEDAIEAIVNDLDSILAVAEKEEIKEKETAESQAA